tara:strand:- start:291 stop:470 length:180 start_codon:yes stop_codon:yes gene_type:complete
LGTLWTSTGLAGLTSLTRTPVLAAEATTLSGLTGSTALSELTRHQFLKRQFTVSVTINL